MKYIPSSNSPEELRRVFLKIQESIKSLQAGAASTESSLKSINEGLSTSTSSQQPSSVVTLHTEFTGTPDDLSIDEDGRAILKQVQVRELAS